MSGPYTTHYWDDLSVAGRCRLLFSVAMLGVFLFAAEATSKPGRKWTLQQLVNAAVQRNPSLGIVRSARTAANEDIAIARGERLPHLNAVGTGEIFPIRERLLIPRHGFRSKANPLKGKNPFENTIVNYGLEVTLPLYTSGRIGHTISLAQARAQAALYRINSTRNELIFNIASTYYTALRILQVISAQRAALASLGESQRIARAQSKAGRVTPLGLLRIETRVSGAKRDLAGARNAYDQAIEILKELANLPQQRKMRVAGRLTRARLRGANTRRLRRQALNNRPDIAVLRSEVEARRSAVGIAGARSGPSLDLRAGYRGVTGIDDGTTRDDATVHLRLKFPLYHGGVLRARERKAYAKLREAEFRLRQKERRVVAEIERAVLNLKSAGPRITAAQKAAIQARETIRVERARFTQGRGTSNDLLLAEEALLRARTALAAALADSQTAKAALRLAIGKIPVAGTRTSGIPVQRRN